MDPVALPLQSLPMAKARRPTAKPKERRQEAIFLNEWLLFRDKSQTWLAERTGYSEPYISLLANMHKRMNLDVQSAFEKALGIERGALLRRPLTDDIWAIWQTLSEEERKRLTAVAKALKGA